MQLHHAAGSVLTMQQLLLQRNMKGCGAGQLWLEIIVFAWLQTLAAVVEDATIFLASQAQLVVCLLWRLGSGWTSGELATCDSLCATGCGSALAPMQPLSAARRCTTHYSIAAAVDLESLGVHS